MLDVEKIRADFPILNQQVYNRPLVYLDNAATTQKPEVVIDAVRDYYLTVNSNIHRSVHYLGQKATLAFEESRQLVREFIHARHPHEIIFTKGATESINLVAGSFGKQFVREGDEIVISAMEHHANIVPWQLMCAERGANLRIIPFHPNGELIMDVYRELLNEHTRLVAVTHVSNALGTINPVKDVIAMAHARACSWWSLSLVVLSQKVGRIPSRAGGSIPPSFRAERVRSASLTPTTAK